MKLNTEMPGGVTDATSWLRRDQNQSLSGSGCRRPLRPHKSHATRSETRRLQAKLPSSAPAPAQRFCPLFEALQSATACDDFDFDSGSGGPVHLLTKLLMTAERPLSGSPNIEPDSLLGLERHHRELDQLGSSGLA
jgi:hypothetical protein